MALTVRVSPRLKSELFCSGLLIFDEYVFVKSSISMAYSVGVVKVSRKSFFRMALCLIGIIKFAGLKRASMYLVS